MQDFVKPLLDLCRRAGDVICEHYHAPHAAEFEAKGDNSPLTRADLDSHIILQGGLEGLDGDIPVLSEESGAVEVAQRLSWPRFWLVDPLDGTKEFLARTGEFTINIALIDNHAPVLGVLYLPLSHRAYVGIPGEGAWCYQYSDEAQWSQRVVATSALREGESLTVLASRRHHGPKLDSCFNWLHQHWGPTRRINSGSALKFCQMVEGDGDFYPRFSPCCEWDTAAGQALLEAAGGSLLGMDGRPFRYNTRQSLLNPDFYAISDAHNPFWRGLFEPAGP
ncbi:MAG: 3'(2'),5'-bisphosphate nucleotidase CysQ [Proteobacteria bacterium]|nr:3'(2'),5'-bisphosphate nucleotidase CysQ [Pseudomonadota bacterium]